MAKKKYYAVKKGLQKGIFETWEECERLVNGYPGAVFKSFTTLEEAEEYINIEKKKPVLPKITETHAVAYVDGSYNVCTEEYAYGAVIIYNGTEEHFSEAFYDPDMSQMRNVAGEIEGAKRAMQYCVENGIESVDIYHDYEGIAAWCTGIWKAKKEGTKNYKEYFDSISDRLRIRFVKVKAHTGDKYNEIADELAKNALGIRK